MFIHKSYVAIFVMYVLFVLQLQTRVYRSRYRMFRPRDRHMDLCLFCWIRNPCFNNRHNLFIFKTNAKTRFREQKV